ncbi:hypothetical protein [Streptomyces roseolilacinus]|uniref:hypothetical protein n=1 Tax=Streptomyces roseolilacinus TaxID=66904 RepID=UPI0038116B3F
MADVAGWLSGMGGAVGAIGGPAGLWAAWNVHRQSHRRRFGPPPELVGLLGKVIDIAQNVPAGYRDAEWFESAGAAETVGRIDELKHLVTDELLETEISLVVSLAESMIGSVTAEWHSPEQRAVIVARQIRQAERTYSSAKDALATLRRKL